MATGTPGRDAPWERAIARVASLSAGGPVDPSLRVTLHFHPDRSGGGVPVIEALAGERVYRSQFETGTSNGGRTAHPGGDRWHWESRIFGGAYDRVAPVHRPKYGSLNFRGRLVGGSPRFGSAYLRLSARTLWRTTFCYPDSVFEPSSFGVPDRLSPLLALARADHRDALDDYIEAHVHGPLSLPDDAEAVVLDPCYRGTFVEHAAARIGCALEWHGGFRLDAGELRRHPDYRGAEYVELGLRLARDGFLDPATLGAASHTGRYREQALKRVWHCVARFGSAELAASAGRADQ